MGMLLVKKEKKLLPNLSPLFFEVDRWKATEKESFFWESFFLLLLLLLLLSFFHPPRLQFWSHSTVSSHFADQPKILFPERKEEEEEEEEEEDEEKEEEEEEEDEEEEAIE